MAKAKEKNTAGKTAEAPAAAPTVRTFTVQQLCTARRFVAHRHALTACLDPNNRYTVGQAQAALDEFMKRKV